MRRPKSTPTYLIRMRAITDKTPDVENPTHAIRPKSSVLPSLSRSAKFQVQTFLARRRAEVDDSPSLDQNRPKSVLGSRRDIYNNASRDEVLSSIDLNRNLQLTRTKHKIHVKVSDPPPSESESEPEEKEPEEKSFADQQREALILQLQEQIQNLSIELENERMNHRMTRQLAADELINRIEDLREEQIDTVNAIRRDFNVKIERMEQNQQHDIEKINIQHKKQIQVKIDQYNLLQAAFDTFKKSTSLETERKLKELEEKMIEEAVNHQTNALKEQEERLLRQKNNEIERLIQKQAEDIELLLQKHELDKEKIIKEFDMATEDLHKLKRTLEELDLLKKMHDETEADLRNLQLEVNEKNRLLSDTRLRLCEYENTFEKRVSEIENKFWQRSEHLLGDNVSINFLSSLYGRRYNQKLDELIDIKASVNDENQQRAVSAAETMKAIVSARSNANVNIACYDAKTFHLKRKSFVRRMSDPTTAMEEKEARMCAGETDFESVSSTTSRPKTCVGSIRRK